MTKNTTTADEQTADLISTGDAAEVLGISPRRVIQLIKDERLPYAMKVGRNYLIRRSDLHLVEDRKVGRPSKKGDGAGG